MQSVEIDGRATFDMIRLIRGTEEEKINGMWRRKNDRFRREGNGEIIRGQRKRKWIDLVGENSEFSPISSDRAIFKSGLA